MGNELNFFSQVGVGAATLAILWFVVKYFITAIEKKDGQIMELIRSFNTTINNHIVHETEAAKKETMALTHLTKAINALIIELKKK